VSQNIFKEIYQNFSSFKILLSTEGIFIFLLITSILSKPISQGLNIFNNTFVHAGHFILSTASYKFKFSNSILFALIIISHSITHASFAGDHLINPSILIHISVFSTNAPIHSKSQFRLFLKLSFSLGSIKMLCLSPKESTNHFIIQFTISFF
jgi:hypothetical protein